MLSDQDLYDRKTQPEPRVVARPTDISLRELTKDVWKSFAADTLTGIPDMNRYGLFPFPHGDRDTSAIRREFDRVRDKIGQNLLEPAGVTENDHLITISVEGEIQGMRFGGRFLRLVCCPDDLAEVGRMKFEPKFARGHARRVDQIVDKFCLQSGATLDRFESVAPCVIVDLLSEQDLRPAQDRIERRSQFVRHESEEKIFCTICLFGFIARAF